MSTMRPAFWPTLAMGAALLLALMTPVHADPRPSPPASKGIDDAGGPSTAIYPPQTIPLHFDHARHTAKMRIPCTYCHPQATTSGHVGDRLLPSPSRCDPCHTSDHSDLNAVRGSLTDCGSCHVDHDPRDGNRVARVVLPTANLRFSHRAHAERNIACGTCHASVRDAGLATRDHLPRMPTCLGCHAQTGPAAGDARGECTVCHLSEEGQRIRTEFPTGTLLPPRWLGGADHGPGWSERHKHVAASNTALCSTCHEERECVDCHDGRVRPRRIHPNDWLSLHAAAAKQGSPTCTDCHRQQSFCLSCHQRVGVSARGPDARSAERGRFHPPAAIWSGATVGAGHHGWEAKRNLNVCVSCHTERDCTTCHATRAAGSVMPSGARGRSPHPPGFAGACRSAFSKNPRPCLVCHLPSAPELARCR
jgi:hypothetical protein